MNLFGFSELEILAFILVLVRIAGIIAFFPFTGDALVPVSVKVLLSLGLALAVFPGIRHGAARLDPAVLNSNGLLLAVAVKEIALGILIGFAANLVFQSIAFAAQYMGMQMGFGLANVYDPSTGMRISGLARFYIALSMLLFLAMDGHHLLLGTMNESFTRISIGAVNFDSSLQKLFLGFTAAVFTTAIKLSAPIVMVILMINVGMGMIARAVPQMNVLLLSLSVNIFAGLLVLFLSLPMFSEQVGGLFNVMTRNVGLVIKACM